MVLIWEVFQALICICSQDHTLTRWMFLWCPVTGTGSIWGVHLVGCFSVWWQKQSRLVKCRVFFKGRRWMKYKKRSVCVSVIHTLSSQACSAELNQMGYLCGILPQNLHTLHTCVISLSSPFQIWKDVPNCNVPSMRFEVFMGMNIIVF
jgi:hypothetical protein